MRPEGNILEISSISTFQQGLTHSAMVGSNMLQKQTNSQPAKNAYNLRRRKNQVNHRKNHSWATRPWRRGVSARRSQHYIVTSQEGKGWMRGILS